MSTDSSKSLRGSCACGATTYTSTEPPFHLDYCYCTQCQRVSGSPVVPWLCFMNRSLAFQGQAATTFRLSTFASRTCCATCGGTLTLQYDDYPEKTYVAAGSIVESAWELPGASSHMFVRSKPGWFVIGDDGVERWELWAEEFVRDFGEVVRRAGKAVD